MAARKRSTRKKKEQVITPERPVLMLPQFAGGPYFSGGEHKKKRAAPKKRSAPKKASPKKSTGRKKHSKAMVKAHSGAIQHKRTRSKTPKAISAGELERLLHRFAETKPAKRRRKSSKPARPKRERTVEEIRREARAIAARRSRLVLPHKSAKSSCKLCGKFHTRSQHRSHKYGGKLLALR